MPQLGQRFFPHFWTRRVSAPRPRPFFAPGGNILVAAKLDALGPLLVAAAARLALRLRASLNVLHVSPRPSLPSLWGDTPALSDALADEISQECYEAAIAGPSRALSDWLSGAPPGVTVRHDVALGAPNEEILREAIATQASLIVLGAHREEFLSLPKSLPPASPLNLIIYGPIPVMVIPEGMPPDAFAGRLSLLLDDDMSPQIMPALAAAWDLAHALGNAKLWHAHWAKHGPKADLLAAFPHDKAKPLVNVIPTRAERAPLTVANQLQDRLVERMESVRGEGVCRDDPLYASRVVPTDQPGATAELLNEAHPGMFIVGRHPSWLRHPVNELRRVVGALVEGGIPVLVVPPATGKGAHA